MAKIDWKSPIEAIHGKLFPGFGAAKRKEANNEGEQPNYSVMYGQRKNEPGSDELANRTRFATLSAMVKLRKSTTATRTADQAAFKAQSTYKTLKAYIWAQAKAELDAED